ncbi:nuclear transport factor 2 family protein [uncultured Maribacter sp.]|uniref:YybH family protein n=1 Tax=uncultured Maribacter sp. TaxID=431308 RepID=UPI0030D8DD01|tara:strand:+ start:1460 stop:1897 length:438 start_codon:yes stop_codon:yes gene_type:complete
MKSILLSVIIIIIISSSCVNKNNSVQDKEEIIAVLNQQQKDWSNNDLESFMDGYWKSDSLYFYSGKKLKSGWENTLNSYLKNYPDKSYSGTLKFTIAKISAITPDSYFVMGEYNLTREVGNATGTFMIIFKRIDGEWKIIADSSC